MGSVRGDLYFAFLSSTPAKLYFFREELAAALPIEALRFAHGLFLSGDAETVGWVEQTIGQKQFTFHTHLREPGCDFCCDNARAPNFLSASLFNPIWRSFVMRVKFGLIIACNGLRRYFTLFFSSCFVGARKPAPGIYRLALRVMQCNPQACVFIDDRTLNLESAQSLGIRTIHYRSPAQLLDELQRNGVHVRMDKCPAFEGVS